MKTPRSDGPVVSPSFGGGELWLTRQERLIREMPKLSYGYRWRVTYENPGALIPGLDVAVLERRVAFTERWEAVSTYAIERIRLDDGDHSIRLHPIGH